MTEAVISKAKALSVTETLVIVAVVAVLLGLLVVGLAKTREQARRAACKNHLKQIGLALQLYATDYDSWFPRGPEGAYSSYSLGILFYEGSNYLANANLLLCPGDPDATLGAWDKIATGMSPDNGGLHASSTSYSYDHYKVARIAPDIALVADEMGVEDKDAYGSPGTMGTTEYEIYNRDMPWSQIAGTARTDLNSPNHGGVGQHVLYIDSHVEWAPNPLAGHISQISAATPTRDEIYSISRWSDDPDARADLWPPSQDENVISDHSVVSDTRPPNIIQYSKN